MSMNHELAKELKEAGFPQEGAGRYFELTDGLPKNFVTSKENAGMLHKEFSVYVPTLEELIEACRDIEFRIHCFPKDFGSDITGEPWFVVERPNWSDMPRVPTPNEAVGRLWLALNV